MFAKLLHDIKQKLPEMKKINFKTPKSETLLIFTLGIVAAFVIFWVSQNNFENFRILIISIISISLTILVIGLLVRIYFSQWFNKSIEKPDDDSEPGTEPITFVEWLNHHKQQIFFALSFIVMLGVVAELVIITETLALFLQAERMSKQNDLLASQREIVIMNATANYQQQLADIKIQKIPFEAIEISYEELALEKNSDRVANFLCETGRFNCEKLPDGLQRVNYLNEDEDGKELDKLYLVAIADSALARQNQSFLRYYNTPDETGWNVDFAPPRDGRGDLLFKHAAEFCLVQPSFVKQAKKAYEHLVRLEVEAAHFVLSMNSDEIDKVNWSNGYSAEKLSDIRSFSIVGYVPNTEEELLEMRATQGLPPIELERQHQFYDHARQLVNFIYSQCTIKLEQLETSEKTLKAQLKRLPQINSTFLNETNSSEPGPAPEAIETN